MAEDAKIPRDLWAEFDKELEALVEGTVTAQESYTAAKGMSLASIAVGSAALRLSKVRAMAQARDLQGTKTALEKATLKVREAAFASSGDPEGDILSTNLDILAALNDVFGRMERPVESDVESATLPGIQPGSRGNARTRAPAVQQPKDSGSGEKGEQTRAAQVGVADIQATEGLFHDLGIVEPDDDPLSCMADEDNGWGGGRPTMTFLVEPVDPALVEREKKLYWEGHGWVRMQDLPAGSKMEWLAPTSLKGGRRRHAQILGEALRHLSEPVEDKKGGMEEQVPRSLANTARETMAAGTTSSTSKGAEEGEKSVELTSKLEGGGKEQDASRIDQDMTETLRRKVKQAWKDDYWPRLSLAYTLEEQGQNFSAAGKMVASASSFAEASDLFRICSVQLPMEPETLLRQWVTAQRAREVGHPREPPDIKILRRCIKICKGGNKGSKAKGSCTSPVCLEAHQELVGVLLERGDFERCIEACRHILGPHDVHDAEALYSMAQALVALGRFEEASEHAKTAGTVL